MSAVNVSYNNLHSWESSSETTVCSSFHIYGTNGLNIDHPILKWQNEQQGQLKHDHISASTQLLKKLQCTTLNNHGVFLLRYCALAARGFLRFAFGQFLWNILYHQRSFYHKGSSVSVLLIPFLTLGSAWLREKHLMALRVTLLIMSKRRSCKKLFAVERVEGV